VGFGFTERPANLNYNMENWIRHAVGVLDALGLEKIGLVGNSFGGALALHLAARYPGRISRMALMGSVGVGFGLTPGLDRAWGYEPSLKNMRALLKFFVFNQSMITDDLVKLRHEASLRPGFQESFSTMFPAPRQRWIDAMRLDNSALRQLPHATLIIRGRDDQIIPLENSYRL